MRYLKHGEAFGNVRVARVLIVASPYNIGSAINTYDVVTFGQIAQTYYQLVVPNQIRFFLQQHRYN